MEVGAFPRRGMLYWVRIPGEPGSKRRPALVVSIDVRNRLASDVIVVPASTVTTMAPTHVPLRAGTGGLRSRSVLKCEQIVTVGRDRLEPAPMGGPLPEAILADVEEGILRAIGVAR